jgi:1,4-dihydroxy-2-naphthoate polyprenyltransferase
MSDSEIIQTRQQQTAGPAGSVGAWLQAARPRTLPAVLGPVLLGQVLVADEFFAWSTAVLCLVCGLTLQIAVNLANDLFDGLTGVDQDDRLGPVRAMQSGLISARSLAVGLCIILAVAALTGLWLIIHGHWLLWLLGAAALLAVLGYSGGARPYANLGLGEVVVWIFFGPVAVLGSLLAHGSPITGEAIWAAVLVGLPVAAIMVVNNLRDRHTDRRGGEMAL